jgi:peroxiredoxin/mono/diheme cytochrome c family protein
VITIAFGLVVGLGISPTAQAETKAPAPGATIANFSLPDVHRRPRSLDKFKDKQAFVVVFIGTECPLANLYVPTLVNLHKEYAPKGVQFLAINANPQDRFVSVSAHAQERNVPFPVLKDFDQHVADAFGAVRTPEAFLLDAKHVIRYHGRIDDQYGVGYQREKPRTRDLQSAIDELLAGKPITTPTTEIPGCVVTRLKKPRVEGRVTYAKQVSRILQKRCQECHRPGEIGPFSLLTYDDAKGWADTIREVVQEERMPPWHPDPRFGRFTNDRRLSREEADTLLAWTEQGCPKGDDKDLPPPVQFVEGWKIGKPDAVFSMKEDFKVPSAGVLPYKTFVVDPGFKEDKWIQAAEARPGNRAVVHHVLVHILDHSGEIYDKDGRAATLAGWAPGDMPTLYTKGMAKRVPAGSKLLFEVHYTPNGKEQTDRSTVGVIFAKQPPERIVETNVLANINLRVPPRTARHVEEFQYVFAEDVELLSFMPHMHLRGTNARYVATYLDGRKETLLSVPDYDFNWQSIYRFAKPIPMAKGTKITWIGEWDNSADNPRNPDPAKEVKFGLQTWDEMMNGWMEVVKKYNHENTKEERKEKRQK